MFCCRLAGNTWAASDRNGGVLFDFGAVNGGRYDCDRGIDDHFIDRRWQTTRSPPFYAQLTQLRTFFPPIFLYFLPHCLLRRCNTGRITRIKKGFWGFRCRSVASGEPSRWRWFSFASECGGKVSTLSLHVSVTPFSLHPFLHSRSSSVVRKRTVWRVLVLFGFLFCDKQSGWKTKREESETGRQ